MKSLKQLVNNYGGFLTDEKIILKYFVDNELESEAIDIIKEVSKAKIQKLENQLEYSRSWANSIIANVENMKQYFGEHTTKLCQLQVWYVTNCESDGSVKKSQLDRTTYIKGIMEEIKDIKLPNSAYFFFRPCLEWLHSQGIYFKNEVKND